MVAQSPRAGLKALGGPRAGVASAGPKRSQTKGGADGHRVTVEPDGELAAPAVVLHADGAALLQRSQRHGRRRVRHGEGCGRGDRAERERPGWAGERRRRHRN